MPRPHKPIHLLIIDDDVSIKELLVEYLATRGFRVDGTSDGRVALELMRSGGYDLILTDYQVPHVDGLDILRVARQMSPPLPTILMTGYGTVETAVSALKDGAADFLLKPFRLKVVYESIQQALERDRQHRADGQLASVVALYDFAGTVRNRWHLNVLHKQIATRMVDELHCHAAVVVAEAPDTGAWETFAPGDYDDGELPDLLQHLYVPALLDAVEPEQTLLTDEPERLFSSAPPGARLPAWVAARPFLLDPGNGEASVAGVLVAAWEIGEAIDTNGGLQPLVRYATLAGNALSRVQQLDPLPL